MGNSVVVFVSIWRPSELDGGKTEILSHLEQGFFVLFQLGLGRELSPNLGDGQGQAAAV